MLAVVLAGCEPAVARHVPISSARKSEMAVKAIAPTESVFDIGGAWAEETGKSAPEMSRPIVRKKRNGGGNGGQSFPTDSVVPASKEKRLSAPDSIQSPADTARLRSLTDSVAANTGVPKPPGAKFVPDPKRALWLSLVLPGAGQIYNRKYWKLPIIYGGFLGCAYALMWNQQMYRDYSQAYLDIMDDDPDTHSYLDMLPPRYDISGREEQFQSLFKRKKDYYRRYRDLSAFCFIGVYLISVIDAYVDAQLSVFDISPDLTMRVEPAVIDTPSSLGKRSGTAYGLGCSFRF